MQEITIVGNPSVSQPPASNHGSARPADEPDIPGQMSHHPAGASVPTTPIAPTTAAIGQSEVPSVSQEADADNEPSELQQAAGGFAQGVFQGLLPGGFLLSSSHPDSATYETARGIGQIIGGIAATILGRIVMAKGAAEVVGGAIGTIPSGGATLTISAAGSIEVTAGAVMAVGGIINIVAGISTIANASTGSGTGGSGGNNKNPVLNQKAGDKWRDEVADHLKQNGVKVVGKEQYKWTPFGRRFIDIEVINENGELAGIETKVGSSRYHKLQEMKDWWLKHYCGYSVTPMWNKYW